MRFSAIAKYVASSSIPMKFRSVFTFTDLRVHARPIFVFIHGRPKRATGAWRVSEGR